LVTLQLLEKFTPGRGNQEIYLCQFDKMRDRLGYKQAVELERMMIERIIVCWLRLQYAEIDGLSTVSWSCSIEEAEYVDSALTEWPDAQSPEFPQLFITHPLRRFKRSSETSDPKSKIQNPGPAPSGGQLNRSSGLPATPGPPN